MTTLLLANLGDICTPFRTIRVRAIILWLRSRNRSTICRIWGPRSARVEHISPQSLPETTVWSHSSKSLDLRTSPRSQMAPARFEVSTRFRQFLCKQLANPSVLCTTSCRLCIRTCSRPRSPLNRLDTPTYSVASYWRNDRLLSPTRGSPIPIRPEFTCPPVHLHKIEVLYPIDENAFIQEQMQLRQASMFTSDEVDGHLGVQIWVGYKNLPDIKSCY